MSNREIAEVLKGRNKEAVKKRLQLLKSKGLIKRGQSLKSEPDDA
jgi:predicted transcriptional regulator